MSETRDLPWDIVMKKSKEIEEELTEFHCRVRDSEKEIGITSPGQIAINIVLNDVCSAQITIDTNTPIGILRSVIGTGTCHGIDCIAFEKALFPDDWSDDCDDSDDIIPNNVELDDEKTVNDYPQCLTGGGIFPIFFI